MLVKLRADKSLFLFPIIGLPAQPILNQTQRGSLRVGIQSVNAPRLSLDSLCFGPLGKNEVAAWVLLPKRSMTGFQEGISPVSSMDQILS